MSSNRQDHSNKPSSVNVLQVLRDSFSAAGVAGLVETTLFHPADTMAKRLKVNANKEFKLAGENFGQAFSRVAFKAQPGSSFSEVFVGLYGGINWALGYKFIQRGAKIGLQKPLQEFIHEQYDNQLEAIFGKHKFVASNGLAGLLLGVSEIALLPLDAYKIKSQTNKEAYKGLSWLEVAKSENMFKGMSFTIMRNSIGSFALFGVPEVMKTEVFGKEPNEKVSASQSIALKVTGSVSSIVISSPFDVVKTRIQKEKDKVSGMRIAFNIFHKEGVRAFYKGCGLQTLMQAPKLAFSMFMADQLVEMLKTHRAQNDRSNTPSLR